MRKSYLLFLLMGMTQIAYAKNIKSTIYEMGSQRKKVLFTGQLTDEVQGDQVIERAYFRTPEGTTIFKEELVLKNNKIVKHHEEMLQTGARGGLQIEGDKIHFKYTKPDAKEKMDSEKLTENFVVGLTLMRFIDKNWDDLVNGKKVDIRFSVLDRLETVGFELFREKKMEKSPDQIVVKMKPSTWVIALLVDPVHFYINKESRKLMSYIGRVKPKQLQGKDWKPLDAEVVYEHIN